MKTLFVFLLIITLSVAAAPKDEVPESGPENNTSAVETTEGFAWLGVGLAGSGTALIIGLEIINGNDLFNTLEAATYGAGLGMIASGCAVTWKALPKKPKQKNQ